MSRALQFLIEDLSIGFIAGISGDAIEIPDLIRMVFNDVLFLLRSEGVPPSGDFSSRPAFLRQVRQPLGLAGGSL